MDKLKKEYSSSKSSLVQMSPYGNSIICADVPGWGALISRGISPAEIMKSLKCFFF